MKAAQTSLLDELTVDNFAGGGGASTGIELATGRPVDIAINHDPDAIAMHRANHPYTEHFQASVWDIEPQKVCGGRKVGLAWFSPDCKHFSKAKGGKPVDKNIRGLAWIALRWAGTVRPRVIMLENVVEFQTWGPVRRGKPVKSKQGQTFRKFVTQLEDLGYAVEFWELRACDYGAATIRKRFFMVARCDGQEIVWPEPTHGEPHNEAVKIGRLLPWKTAAEIIDWTLPCPSIFERDKPLAENTMRRIARGIQKFVVDNPEPFIVQINHAGTNFRGQRADEPLSTLTAKNELGVVAPLLIQYHGEKGATEVRGQRLDRPIMTIDSNPRYALTTAFIAKQYGGGYTGPGSGCVDPLGTVTSIDHNALVSAFITKFYKTGIGQDAREPLHTVTTSPGHLAEVRAFLIKYYGQDVGQAVNQPLGTVVSKDKFGLVTVHGETYQIVDIGLRMLTPRELYAAQGFPADYIIDKDDAGKVYPKSKQVARCGNAVPPAFAEALVRANLPEWCGAKIDTMRQLEDRIAI